MKLSDIRKSITSGFSKITESDWATIAALVAIFFLALFLRSFFGLGVATEEGFLLSGGSDSYYHKRIIDYVVDTGHHPYLDYMLNYPVGIHSGRPPLYDWSVAVSGIAFSPLFGSVDVSVWYSFLFSTAIWGALTIFPLYFMTKEAFGKKVGLLAAFFLAIMPAHIQRSPLTNGDHDSFVLFFAVLTFYFFLKALKILKEKEWITSWRRPRSVLGEIRTFLLENRKAVLYSAMAGISIGAIALAWTGFSYIIVILVVFFIVQILINRMKNRDSFGLIVCFAITIGIGLLISFPYYYVHIRIESWFDTPTYMLLIAVAFGMLFVLTRKYPWMLVIPSVFAFFAIGLLVISVINPTVASNFFSGFGYFIRTKTYETIAEAQPPNFSTLALSFGAITLYLSLFGLAWSVIQIPKNLRTDYIFLVVWIVLSIYMAMAAARFLFNGAPAFAMTSAWITILALDKIDIKGARKTYRSTGGNRLQAFRKSVKIRHIAGVLLVAFLIILPNVWFGIDASIPYEEKREYDAEIYNAMPPFARSDDYQEGSLWYLGAFGYSLPLKSRYWPTAYTWLSEQDNDIPIANERPAIVSWWDYGFEFVQEGKHPTVADNFLNGYQLAGNFIMSQNEKDAIALLAIRLIEGNYHRFDTSTGYQTDNLDEDVKALLVRHGFNPSDIEDVLRNPQNYIDIVKSDPEKYGPRSSDLREGNAMYLYLRGMINDRFTTDELVLFYHDLRETTGNSIRYFAVDTRLFPFTAQVTGIFYAPAKLSDHRIEQGAPIDFYEIKAVSEFGAEYSTDEIPPGTTITDYKLVYKDMFYNSMFYRTFAGYSGKDIGQEEGIPGLTESLAQQQILPAWNLNHFKMVYRTSYYNPYPPADVQNHTDEWRAINFEEAVELQQQIQEGTANGTIDINPRTTLQNGVVIIKYYDGAFVNGTVSIDGVTPFSGVTITIQDEFGVPHYTTTTDENGRYSALAPFGKDISLVASIGAINNLTSVGSTVLMTSKFDVTDEQAMRVPQDTDGDGLYDYLITDDIEIEGGDLKGTVFIDMNNNGTYEPSDIPIDNATLVLTNKDVDISLGQSSNVTGGYEFLSIYPGSYEVVVSYQGREFSGFTTEITEGETSTLTLNMPSATVSGLVLDENDNPRIAEVSLKDLTNGTTITTNSNATGSYEFKGLLYGNYTISARDGDLSNVPVAVSISKEPEDQEVDLSIMPSGILKGKVEIGVGNAPYATLKVRSFNGVINELARSDVKGNYELVLPEGSYSIYSTYYYQNKHYAFLGRANIIKNETLGYDVVLEESSDISGTVYFGLINTTQRNTKIGIESIDGNGKVEVVSNNNGYYSFKLPNRNYRVIVTENFYFMGTIIVDGDTVFNIPLAPGEVIDGSVFYDLNNNDYKDVGEGLSNVNIGFTDSLSRRIDVYTDNGGDYRVSLNNESYSVSVNVPGYEPYITGLLGIEELRESSKILIVPTNVTLSGNVLFEGTPLNASVPVSFSPESDGAIATTTFNNTGTYDVSLRPGDYSVTIDHMTAPREKYQNAKEELLSLSIGEETHTMDIEVVKKFELNGSIELEGVDPTLVVDVELDFDGPEQVNILSNNEFNLYLTEGKYSIRANFSLYDEHFLNLTTVDMTGPQDISIKLEPTVRVAGDVLYEGVSIGENLTISFSSSSGGIVRTQSDPTGNYEIYLSAGDYTIEINHTTTESNGALRYIRYLADSFLTVSLGAPHYFDLHLIKTLDNATFEGTVFSSMDETISTELEFVKMDNSAINATVLSSSNGKFSISLHPGFYTIYVEHEGDVYLDTVTIAPGDFIGRDIMLEKGYRLEGTLYMKGAAVEGSLSLVHNNSNARLYVSTSLSGKFDLHLPEGEFNISSSTNTIERGIDVRYTNLTKIQLDTDKIIDLNLEKVKVYSVEMFWDSAQRKTINGNETVIYTITLNNTGNADDSYVLVGSQGNWIMNFNPSTVSVNFGIIDNSREVEVTITSPLDALVAHEDLNIMAHSRNDTLISGNLLVYVDISPKLGVELNPSNETPTFSQDILEYKFDVKNTGNEDDSYTVIIANIDELELKGWTALINSSGLLDTRANISISPNSKIILGLQMEIGFEAADVMILAYSNSDRGADDVIAISASMPTIDMSVEDVGVEGEGLSLSPPDTIVTNIVIVMVFIIIATIIAIIILRRKK